MSVRETMGEALQVLRFDAEAVGTLARAPRVALTSIIVCSVGYGILRLGASLGERTLGESVLAGAVGAVVVVPMLFVHVGIVAQSAQWLGGSGHMGLLWRPVFLATGLMGCGMGVAAAIVPAGLSGAILLGGGVYALAIMVHIVKIVFSIDWTKAIVALLSPLLLVGGLLLIGITLL